MFILQRVNKTIISCAWITLVGLGVFVEVVQNRIKRDYLI